MGVCDLFVLWLVDTLYSGPRGTGDPRFPLLWLAGINLEVGRQGTGQSGGCSV